jgi:hypothetical protein
MILDYLSKLNINSIDRVGKVINMYYTDKDKLVNLIKNKMKLQIPNEKNK